MFLLSSLYSILRLFEDWSRTCHRTYGVEIHNHI